MKQFDVILYEISGRKTFMVQEASSPFLALLKAMRIKNRDLYKNNVESAKVTQNKKV